MTNAETTLTNQSTVTLDQARRIFTEHGFTTTVEDEGNGAVGLYVEMPWSMADGNGGFRSGTDTEHVQDTETGRIHVSHIRQALGY